jgi:hypothetical protein
MSGKRKRDRLSRRRLVATDYEANAEIARALLEFTTNRTLAIVVHGGDLVTGICVEFEERLFVATVAHAIKGASPDDIEFFARSSATMTIGTKSDVGTRITREVGRRGFRPQLGAPIFAPDPEDLALLPISREEADRYGLRFHQVTRDRISPPVGETVFVVGHPSELVRDARSLRTGAEGKVTHPNGEWLPVVAGKGIWLKGYDPRLHYLLDFRRQDPREEVQNPVGMSGAGVWKIPPRASPREIWNPGGTVLVGIQTGWYERRHLLLVTRIRRALRLLQS